MTCLVNGCKAKYIGDRAVSFHRIYQNGAFKEEWVEAIQRHNNQEIDRSIKSSKICCLHFERKMLKNLGCQMRLVADAVPTIFPAVEKVTATNQSSNLNAATPTSSEKHLVGKSYEAATLRTLKCSPRRLKLRLVHKARILKFIERQLERRKKQNGKLTNTIFGLQRFRPDPGLVNTNGRTNKNT